MYYYIGLKRKEESCPYCSGDIVGHGHKEKVINHPCLRESKCVIVFNAKRYKCKSCNKTFLQENPFSFKGFNSSYLLLRNVMLKLANLNYTLTMISNELNISVTQINKYLDSYITLPRPHLPECLGIDEIHNPEMAYKGSSYLCVMVDNEKRCLNDVLGSRSKRYLDNYFYSFSQEEKDKVKYVTIDMWESYLDLAHKHFKNAIIAVDPFHVIEHLCRDFKQIRINIMNQQIYGSNAYYLLKNWSWLLETDDVNLNNDPVYNSRFKMKLNRKDIFEMLLDLSPILKEAYYLKQTYRTFNKTMSYEEALDNYDVLVKEFEDVNIKEYREFVSILINWKNEILNSFKRPYENRKLSNAFCENINGKINSYLTISRGIINFDRFRKRIMYALNHKISYSLTSCLNSLQRKGKLRGQYNKPIE